VASGIAFGFGGLHAGQDVAREQHRIDRLILRPYFGADVQDPHTAPTMVAVAPVGHLSPAEKPYADSGMSSAITGHTRTSIESQQEFDGEILELLALTQQQFDETAG
jgi:hypothetical protein